MLNINHASSNINFSIFNEKFELAINPTQKRIILIAALAFACLTIVYTAITCYRQISVKKDQPDINPDPTVKQTKVDDKEKQSRKCFLEAMELMFHDRGLQWGVWLDSSKWTPKQKTERHEKLKKAIEGILPEDINCTTEYREAMNTRSQTLLLQAIMNIQDPAKRLEIVQILLDKGADPKAEGLFYAPVYPLSEAENTKDQQLIDLISNAILKRPSKI